VFGVVEDELFFEVAVWLWLFSFELEDLTDEEFFEEELFFDFVDFRLLLLLDRLELWTIEVAWFSFEVTSW